MNSCVFLADDVCCVRLSWFLEHLKESSDLQHSKESHIVKKREPKNSGVTWSMERRSRKTE